MPFALTFPERVLIGRHLPWILTWPFLHFLALAACAELIVAVGTVTSSVACPAWTGTKVIVIVPLELALIDLIVYAELGVGGLGRNVTVAVAEGSVAVCEPVLPRSRYIWIVSIPALLPT